MPVDPPRSASGWGRIPRLTFGGDYNPEQWDPQVWKEDVRLMQEAGVNLVTLGVFAWSWIEPEQDRFDFSGMDQVVELLHSGGIRIDLATPSASPPPWFSENFPEALPMDQYGRRLRHGSRQAFCASSGAYRERTAMVVEQLAQRYAHHPAVVMWHVGNEFGGYNIHCYCPSSAAAFRSWLMHRHGSLEDLNQAWGTSFWSQRYSAWSQVYPPGSTPGRVNPAQQLDFYRFSSDAQLECYRAERDLISRYAPQTPVTTNFMAGTFKWVDYFRWAPEVDLVSNDHYLVAADPDNHIGLALSADLSRGLAAGRPWLLMEHSTSAVQWQPRNVAKRPGELLRNSLAHVARGSDGACFFQWRQSDSGVEKWHSAMLPHGGTATRNWREVKQLGAVLNAAAEVAGSTVEREVALLWDYESFWALEMDARPSVDMRYASEVSAWHRALWKQGVTCDIVSANMTAADLSSYRLVLVPSLYLMRQSTADALTAYTQAGGHVVVGPFSGVVDAQDRVLPGSYPGMLRDLLGLRIDEFLPLAENAAVALDDGSVGHFWTERVEARGATVEVTFTNGPAAGGPAVLHHRVGRGLVRYAATRFEAAALDGLLTRALDEAGCAPCVPGAGEGVEAVRRLNGERSWLFVLNHTDRPARIDCHGVDLLSGGEADGSFSLAPGGAAVIREQSAG
ncbi:beta-galactosidase [Streptacidiphilus sp. EB103A]|uniref:beta-galactosidase n=1 Tax=Streptacidiphilus sp. EB103A TaxID=3156275 RepID=UPI0035133C0D